MNTPSSSETPQSRIYSKKNKPSSNHRTNHNQQTYKCNNRGTSAQSPQLTLHTISLGVVAFGGGCLEFAPGGLPLCLVLTHTTQRHQARGVQYALRSDLSTRGLLCAAVLLCSWHSGVHACMESALKGLPLHWVPHTTTTPSKRNVCY